MAPCLAALAATTDSSGPVAQWIRHRPTEPGIAGSSPAGVIAADPIQTAQRSCPRPCGPSSLWLSPSTTMFGFCRAYQANTLMPCRTVSAGQLAWTLCPSGLRGWTQVPLAQAAWVQIPQVSFMTDAHGANLGMDGRMEAHVNTAPLYSFLSFLLPFSVQCYYLFISFALPRSLSLSLYLALSRSLSLSLSLSLALVPPFCHPGHVFHSPACSAAGELHGCMSSERHTRPPLQFKKRFTHDVELLAS